MRARRARGGAWRAMRPVAILWTIALLAGCAERISFGGSGAERHRGAARRAHQRGHQPAVGHHRRTAHAAARQYGGALDADVSRRGRMRDEFRRAARRRRGHHRARRRLSGKFLHQPQVGVRGEWTGDPRPYRPAAGAACAWSSRTVRRAGHERPVDRAGTVQSCPSTSSIASPSRAMPTGQP